MNLNAAIIKPKAPFRPPDLGMLHAPNANALLCPDGVSRATIIGGFTKLEAAALQIAGHICGELRGPDEGSFNEQFVAVVAEGAVDLAKAVLEECAKVSSKQ